MSITTRPDRAFLAHAWRVRDTKRKKMGTEKCGNAINATKNLIRTTWIISNAQNVEILKISS